jgi:hypothetical protein
VANVVKRDTASNLSDSFFVVLGGVVPVKLPLTDAVLAAEVTAIPGRGLGLSFGTVLDVVGLFAIVLAVGLDISSLFPKTSLGICCHLALPILN